MSKASRNHPYTKKIGKRSRYSADKAVSNQAVRTLLAPFSFRVLLQMCSNMLLPSRYRATLGNDLLAITYKLDGRKITLADALATMSRDKQAIQSIIAYYQGGLQNYANAIGQSTLRQISNALNSVSTELSLSDGMRQTISSDPTISDEPIVTLIEPPGGSIFSAPVWNEYHASVIAGNRLSIDAKKSYVAYVDWGTETIIALHNDPNRYIVAPLEYVDENDRDDQVHEGDVAVLAGQYMILAEPVEEEGTDGLIMSNYLKVTASS